MEPLVAQARRQLIDGGVPETTAVELSDASLGLRHLVTDVAPDVMLEDGDGMDLPGWDVRVL